MWLSCSLSDKVYSTRKSSASRSTKSIQSIRKKNIQHKDQKSKHIKEVQLLKPDTFYEFAHINPPEICAVLPYQGENLSYVRLKFLKQFKRTAFTYTGSCANAFPEFFFNDLSPNNPKSLTLEKASLNSARKASGQKIPIAEQTQS